MRDRSTSVAAILLFALVALAPRTDAAESDWRTWQRNMEYGERALEQGRIATAESWFASAVREAERIDPRDSRLAESLAKLLELYRKQGRSREADAIQARLGAAMPPPPTPADVVAALDAYAGFLRQLGRDREARAIARSAEQVRATGDGQGDARLLYYNPVADLRQYAALLRVSHRDAEAQRIAALASGLVRDLVTRYTKLRRGVAADNALPSLTHMRQVEGGVEALRARLYPEAEAFFADAVKTAEGFTAADVTLAYTVTLLATSYAAQGKRPEFDRAVARAWPALERAGLSHQLVLPGLRTLVIAYLRYDFDPPRAQAHIQRSLRVVERDVGRDHPTVGLHLAGLAATHLAVAGPDAARPYLQPALAIADRQYLPEHVHLAFGLMRVVDVAFDRQDYALAHEVAGRVVAILKRMLDPGHPDVLLAAETLRLLDEKVGRPAERVVLGGATAVPVEFAGNAVLTHVTVNGTQRARLVVDTGAATTILRPVVLMRLGLPIPASAPRRTFQVVGGGTIDVAIVTLASLRVGEATVENLDVAVGDALPDDGDVDGLLGSDFLQRFRMTIDKATRRMTLEAVTR